MAAFAAFISHAISHTCDPTGNGIGIDLMQLKLGHSMLHFQNATHKNVEIVIS